jgi:hypothetical protein
MDVWEVPLSSCSGLDKRLPHGCPTGVGSGVWLACAGRSDRCRFLELRSVQRCCGPKHVAPHQESAGAAPSDTGMACRLCLERDGGQFGRGEAPNIWDRSAFSASVSPRPVCCRRPLLRLDKRRQSKPFARVVVWGTSPRTRERPWPPQRRSQRASFSGGWASLQGVMKSRLGCSLLGKP